MAKVTWTIEDHICSSCGGRIVRSAKGTGPTPGGNPVYKCSLCGKVTTEMGGHSLCWCGYSQKSNNNSLPYKCVPYSILEKYPDGLSYFKFCGCDPRRGGEVGVMLEEDWNELRKKDIAVQVIPPTAD